MTDIANIVSDLSRRINTLNNQINDYEDNLHSLEDLLDELEGNRGASTSSGSGDGEPDSNEIQDLRNEIYLSCWQLSPFIRLCASDTAAEMPVAY